MLSGARDPTGDLVMDTRHNNIRYARGETERELELLCEEKGEGIGHSVSLR